MARTEGIRGMMRGNLANCVRITPNSAVKFFMYEQITRCAQLVPLLPLPCCCSCASHPPYASPFGSVCHLMLRHAANNPMWVVTVLAGCWLTWHNACLLAPHLRREMSDLRRVQLGSGELTPVLRLAAGAMAGIVAMSSTYWLDMIRGRLTVQEGTNQQYRGILHAARVILKEVRRGRGAGRGARRQEDVCGRKRGGGGRRGCVGGRGKREGVEVGAVEGEGVSRGIMWVLGQVCCAAEAEEPA